MSLQEEWRRETARHRLSPRADINSFLSTSATTFSPKLFFYWFLFHTSRIFSSPKHPQENHHQPYNSDHVRSYWLQRPGHHWYNTHLSPLLNLHSLSLPINMDIVLLYIMNICIVCFVFQEQKWVFLVLGLWVFQWHRISSKLGMHWSFA